MKNTWIKRSASGLFAALVLCLGGCVGVGGYGYDGDPGYYGGSSVGYGVGFYQPYGYNYGGWRPGYQVGPPSRGGFDHPGRSYSRPSGPSYRPAAPSRPMPSIPMQPRGGGSGRQHH
jgi:hypothetical protein